MKAPFSLLARCLLFTFILANSLDAANPTAADVRRALGADRGLFVVLSNDAWPLASELVKTTELTLLVQTSDLTAVARMQKQAENAGWLGSRVYVEHGGKRIHLARHMADGVIVATPTGTTGYVQAANGPVLHPEVRDLVINPIVPFLTPSNAIVVGHDVRVELLVYTTHEATLSIDGQTDHLLASGDKIVCQASKHVARFARFRERDYFYATLAEKLRWRVPRDMPRPIPGSS